MHSSYIRNVFQPPFQHIAAPHSHSPWDPREELPEQYARIFQFQNFAATQRRVLKSDPEQLGVPCAPVGALVSIHIANVPQHVAEQWRTINRDSPLVLFGLMEHENKMTVLNMKLWMRADIVTPIKSKTRLIFYTGLRQFTAEPIFSQHSYGDKHKFERYWQPGGQVIATTLAPIHYPPCPTLVFQKDPITLALQLVGTGAVMGCEPDRIVLKRIRLAGHPFKINKRTSTIRCAFVLKVSFGGRPRKCRTKEVYFRSYLWRELIRGGT